MSFPFFVLSHDVNSAYCKKGFEKKKPLKNLKKTDYLKMIKWTKLLKLFSLYILYVTLYFWLYLVFRTPDAIRFLTFQK